MSTTETQLRYTSDEYYGEPHLGCPGCPIPLALRYFLKVIGEKVVLLITSGCATLLANYPSRRLKYQGRNIEVASCPLGSAATFAGGIKSALVARGDTETTVVAWVGDGATYDIGLGAVSAAAERNEDIIYVCYDNEIYGNTGGQRSSATPWGARTTTTMPPTTKVENKKDIMSIILAHGIPYAATATVADPDDLMRKAQKAKDTSGFRFLYIFIPCQAGWRFPAGLTIQQSQLAVDTKVFPVYEVENGTKFTINKEPKGIPVEEYIKVQGRYRHLTPEQIAQIQETVEEKWNRLQWLASYQSQS